MTVLVRRGLHRPAGFSLVELLLVVALLGILVALGLPAMRSLLDSQGLARAGRLIADELALARQEAMARNRPVEVRFFRIPAGEQGAWEAIQSFAAERDGHAAITRLHRLPDSTRMGIAHSPLLATLLANPATAVLGTEVTQLGGSADYVALRFQPSGELDWSVRGTNTYLTVVAARDADRTEPPANYFSILVNPATGRSAIFRP